MVKYVFAINLVYLILLQSTKSHFYLLTCVYNFIIYLNALKTKKRFLQVK